MRITIPTPLRSYTHASEVPGAGSTVREVLADLDRRFPGIRFRMLDEQGYIRPHMRIFHNDEQVVDLDSRVADTDEIHILQALSGG